MAIKLTSVILSNARSPVPVTVLTGAGAPMKSEGCAEGLSLPPPNCIAGTAGGFVLGDLAVKSAVIAIYSARLLIAVRPYSAGFVAPGCKFGLPLCVRLSKDSTGLLSYSTSSLKFVASPSELGTMRTLILLPQAPSLMAEMARAPVLIARLAGEGGLVAPLPTTRTM